MIAKIKFSHAYSKMPDHANPSRLLEVFTVDRSELHRCFVDYDTKISFAGNYSLPKGKLLVLLLLSEEGELWTTLRKCSPEKRDYYRGMRCKVFDIDVVESNESLMKYL